MFEELCDRIREAQEMLLKDNIEANTVVLNGNKYAKYVKPGYKPMIFGMAIEYDNLPDDLDFIVRYVEPQRITNANYLRSLSDEELASFFASVQLDEGCCDGGFMYSKCEGLSCYDCWFLWLKQTHESWR